jgi:hypothetical protein
MVATARFMFGDAPPDLFRVKDSLALEPLAVEKLVHQGGQRPAQPGGHGDAEALLGTSQDRRRKPAGRGALEQALGLVSPELELRRERLAEIHQLRVQKRRPDLEAAGHAGAIDLGEDILGKIRILVESQRPGKRVSSTAQGSRPAQVLALDVRRAISAPENEPNQR